MVWRVTSRPTASRLSGVRRLVKIAGQRRSGPPNGALSTPRFASGSSSVVPAAPAAQRIFKNDVCFRGEQGISLCVLVPWAHHDVRSPGRSASLPPQEKRSPGFGIVAVGLAGAGYSAEALDLQKSRPLRSPRRCSRVQRLQLGVGVVCLFETSAGWAESEARVGSVVEVVVDEHDVVACSVKE